MNCKVFTLPEISSDLCHVRDIVSSVLHTILFGRALGPIRPKDVECSSLDITYVHCGDKAVQREVADRVDQLLAYLHRRCVAQPIEQKGNSYYTNSGSNRGQNNMNSAALCGSSTAISLAVTISFYEKRYKQSWFSKQQEKKYWEQWRLPITVTELTIARSTDLVTANPVADVQAVLRRGSTRSQLHHCLLFVTSLISEQREHIPPVCSSDAISFPVEIIIPSDNDPGYGFDMLKRMLHTTPGLI